MTRLVCRMALFLLLSTVAFAKEESRPGVTAWPSAWFAASQPGTALDMLRLLPGFRLQEGDTNLRGFAGTLANVLIDGAPPAGKEENAEALLQRIPAREVERIELIRPDSGIDMHGYPLLANVVLAGATSRRGRLELEDAFNHYGQSAPRGALQLTRQGNDVVLDLSASYGRESNGNHGFGRRDRFAADGAVLKLANYAQPELQSTGQASARYRGPLLGGKIDLDGIVKQQLQYSDIAEHIIFPVTADASGYDRTLARGLEAQLHYQHPFFNTGIWEIFLQHRLHEKDAFSRSTDSAGTENSHSRRAMRETVLRGDATKSFGGWSLEAGGEAAINGLNAHSTLEKKGVSISLPYAMVRVVEQRAELFVDVTWHATSALTLEAGGRQEVSRIGESGDASLTRDLAFFKPRLSASWRPASGTELRVSAERRVGQLDFDAFASSANLNSGTVSAGNRNLLPERALRLELAWEQHFWERASLTLTLRRESVTGALDHLPVITATGVFDAIGNGGNGRRDEAQASLILPLAALPGVTLRFDGTLRHSRVIDPVTGASRRISGSQPLEGRIDLTHDLPQWKLRWGVGFTLPRQETDYRIDEIDDRHHISHLDVFIEYRPLPAWTIRLFGQELAQSPYVRDRRLYTGLRRATAFGTDERRTLNNGALLGLNIRLDF